MVIPHDAESFGQKSMGVNRTWNRGYTRTIYETPQRHSKMRILRSWHLTTPNGSFYPRSKTFSQQTKRNRLKLQTQSFRLKLFA